MMHQAGLLVWQPHQIDNKHFKPCATTAEINEAVEQFIADHDAIPLFKCVPGKVPFPAAACISVNEQVVHGIPGTRRLKEGDVISIDIGCKFHGWCGDAAVTHAVGKVSPRVQKLLDVTEGTLHLAFELIPQKTLWSQVAREL